MYYFVNMAGRPNVIGVRVSAAGFAEIEKLRTEYGLSLSTVTRAMIAVAARHEDEVRDMLEVYAR